MVLINLTYWAWDAKGSPVTINADQIRSIDRVAVNGNYRTRIYFADSTSSSLDVNESSETIKRLIYEERQNLRRFETS